MTAPFKLGVNSGPKPAPTHWSNQFTFRRRGTATKGALGKAVVTIDSDLLELIGVKIGEDVIMYVNDTGQIVVVRPEIQL